MNNIEENNESINIEENNENDKIVTFDIRYNLNNYIWNIHL